MQMQAAPVIIQQQAPNILIRIGWFLFLGWWLGGLVSGFAWAVNVTIVGLPLGLWLINRLPSIITLRPQEAAWRIENGVLMRGKKQEGLALRALYFLAIGWWFSGVWIATAYLLVVTIILLPLAFWMYGRIGAVTTLYRS